MATEIESAYKLFTEIGTLKKENESLRLLIAQMRFFGYMRIIAAVGLTSADAVHLTINRLGLTEIFMQVCQEKFFNTHWTNEMKLMVKEPGTNFYAEFQDYDKFISFLINLKV